MTLSDTQIRQLRAKLDPRHVKIRQANGADLHYVEGWHTIAEANRIFGFDAWDRRTMSTRCIWNGASGKCCVRSAGRMHRRFGRCPRTNRNRSFRHRSMQ